MQVSERGGSAAGGSSSEFLWRLQTKTNGHLIYRLNVHSSKSMTNPISAASHISVIGSLEGVSDLPDCQSLDITVVRSSLALSALVDEWRDLQAACGSHIFTDP